MIGRGWSDIAYQLPVDEAGTATASAPPLQIRSHGDEDVNRGAILVVIGEEPTPVMIRAVRDKDRQVLTHLPPRRSDRRAPAHPHDDLGSDECRCPDFMNLIKLGVFIPRTGRSSKRERQQQHRRAPRRRHLRLGHRLHVRSHRGRCRGARRRARGSHGRDHLPPRARSPPSSPSSAPSLRSNAQVSADAAQADEKVQANADHPQWIERTVETVGRDAAKAVETNSNPDRRVKGSPPSPFSAP